VDRDSCCSVAARVRQVAAVLTGDMRTRRIIPRAENQHVYTDCLCCLTGTIGSLTTRWVRLRRSPPSWFCNMEGSVTIMKTGAGIADKRVREGLPGIRIEQARWSFLPVVTIGIRSLAALDSGQVFVNAD
jgi:hypothetical protein